MKNKRLEACLSFVPEGADLLIDVGADHGLLSEAAVRQKKVKKVIAVEVTDGPFERLKKSIIGMGLTDKIEARFGSGFEPVHEDVPFVAVVAGMGGMTIRDIVEERLGRFQDGTRLILQPQNKQAELRKFLLRNGFAIREEALVLEDHYYQIIVAEPGTEPVPSDLLLEVGPRLCDQGGPLFCDYIMSLVGMKEAARESAKTGGAAERAAVLQTDIDSLLALLQ